MDFHGHPWLVLVAILNICNSHTIGQARLSRDTTPQSRDSSSVKVETSLGRVVGRRERVLDSDVDIFLGIPFAKPPVGSLRFKRPVPVDPWSDAINATKLPPTCHQEINKNFDRLEGMEMWNANTEMSEDCLYLNVWSPSRRRDHPRAVMIWIYGGGFVSGTSTLSVYDARLLTTQGDIIVVSMQYRVGVLGFLYLGQDAPGNAGLLDQHLAIRWVYDNIEAFGGDRHRITLFGESAGAASTNFHLLSPLSRPLIKSSIMQSGSVLADWALSTNDTALTHAHALAGLVGCDPNELSDETLFHCLVAVPPESLVKQQSVDVSASSLTQYTPVVDGFFLPEHPQNLLRNQDAKNASILLGTNEDEGNYFLAYFFPNLFNLSDPGRVVTEDEYRNAVSVAFNGFNPALQQLVAFQYETPRVSFRDALDDLYGDAHFKCPVISMAHYYSQMNQDVYLYNFVHRTSASPWPRWMGAMHGYEIDHVFGMPLNTSLQYTRQEYALSSQMIEYWTNFVKTGNPNMQVDDRVTVDFTWPSFDTVSQQYLVFDVNPMVTVANGLRAQQCKFWGAIIVGIQEAAKGLYMTNADDVTYASCPTTSAIGITLLLSCLLTHCLTNLI